MRDNANKYILRLDLAGLILVLNSYNKYAKNSLAIVCLMAKLPRRQKMPARILVALVLGSDSDRQAVEEAEMTKVFDEVGVGWELSIISAHRHHQELTRYCVDAIARDIMVFIGIAGMSAVLPGDIGANISFRRPVIGVPLPTPNFGAYDALFSMISMPAGSPVIICGVGKSGLVNAAIAACQMVASTSQTIAQNLSQYLTARSNKKPPQIRIDCSSVH